MKPKLFRSVHHLRAIAALAICLFHSGFPVGRWQLNAGVPLFFVISGFVIYSSTPAHGFELRAYVRKRFLRIMPLWWAALLWFAGFSIYFSLGRNIDWSYLLTSTILLPTQNTNGDLRPYLNVGWTLVYEVFFYALYGAAAYLGRWWLCSLAIVCLVLAGWFFDPSNFYLQVYTHHIMLGFVAGCHIAQGHASGFKFHRSLLPIGVILLMLWPSLGATIPCTLILAGAIAVEDRWPPNRIMDFLGSASYAIYLFHFSITFVLERSVTPIHWAIVFVLSAALGCAAHVVIERPMMNFLRGSKRALQS